MHMRGLNPVEALYFRYRLRTLHCDIKFFLSARMTWQSDMANSRLPTCLWLQLFVCLGQQAFLEAHGEIPPLQKSVWDKCEAWCAPAVELIWHAMHVLVDALITAPALKIWVIISQWAPLCAIMAECMLVSFFVRVDPAVVQLC